MTQARNKGLCVPVPERGMIDQSLADWSPA